MKRILSLVLLYLCTAVLCLGQNAVNVMVDIEGVAGAGSLPKPLYKGQEKGIVVVKVTLDSQGNVTEAVPGVSGTTNQDSELLNAAGQSAQRARFRRMANNADAPLTGNIIYGFGVELSADNIPGKGLSQSGYISIRDLLDYHTDGDYTIQAFYFGMSDPDSLTFYVQEREDEIFPIRLADKGHETKDQIESLQLLKGGESITVKGTLTTINIGTQQLKGFTQATIVEMPVREAEVSKTQFTKPTFMGRDVNYFSEWVNQRLRYPGKARRQKIEGPVVMTFTIDEEGNLTQIFVKKSPDESLAQEAIRVVSKSPKWQPALVDGKPVKFTVRNYTIVFWL